MHVRNAYHFSGAVPAGFEITYAREKSRSTRPYSAHFFWNHVCTWEMLRLTPLAWVLLLKSRMHVRNVRQRVDMCITLFEITYVREKFWAKSVVDMGSFWNHVCTWEIQTTPYIQNHHVLKSRMHVRNKRSMPSSPSLHFEITYAREKFTPNTKTIGKVFWNHVCTWEIDSAGWTFWACILKSRMHVRNPYICDCLLYRSFEITYAREKCFNQARFAGHLFWNHVCTWEIACP